MGSDDRDRKDRKDRDRDRDRDRERSRRSRSHSRSRSRSRTRSPRKDRRRKSLFDVGGPPPGAAPAVAGFAAAPAGFSAAPAGFSAAPAGFSAAPAGFSAAPAAFPPAPAAPAFPPPPSMPGFAGIPGMTGMTGTIPGFPNMTVMPGMGVPPSQQATRHARRVYVGGLPPTANEQSIASFFSSALAAVGGASAGPGNAVVNVYINKEKNFSFVEFRTVAETSNAMALDGIMFEGVSVRVRRPNDYNAAAAAALGPSGPDPSLNLSAIGLGAGKGGVDTAYASAPAMHGGPHRDENRVFVGGLPYYLTEEQCRELLGSFGQLRSFELIKDKETGQGKGYGFVVYMDPSVTDIAIAGLNGLRMGERTLTVRRAETGGVATNTLMSLSGVPGVPGMPAAAVPGAIPGMMPGAVPGAAPPGPPPGGASRIVVLQEAVTVDELRDDDEYKDIVEDMREECTKYGALRRVIIPRPTPTVANPPGCGKVVIEYEDANSAVRARNAMNGRKFGGRTVVAGYLSEDRYLHGDFDAPTIVA